MIGLAIMGMSQSAMAAPVFDPDTASFVVGSAIIVVALGLALWGYLVGREAMHRNRLARRANDQVTAVLNAAPAAYMSWTRDGHLTVSPRLKEWLGRRGTITAFSDIFDVTGKSGFAEAEFAQLEEVAAAVRTGGPLPAPFEVTGAGRRFAVTCERASVGGAGTISMLWFVDMSGPQHRITEQNKRIQALETSEMHLTQTLNAIDFPIWRRRDDVSLDWVNDAYVRAVEAADLDAVRTDNIELVANALTGSSRDDAARTLAEHRTSATKHYVVIDGQRRALSLTNVPKLDERGQAVVIGYALDVTELEDARAEIARYMESHAETLNKLSTAVAIFGADKTLEFYNNAFTRLWRLTDEWLVTRPHHSELLEEMRERRRLPEQADFPAWKRAHLAHYTTLLEPLEELWHLPDGSTLRVVTQPHPLGGLLIFYEDVTDRLALERSYNTLIAVQQATLNNLHEGIAVFGSDSRMRLYNPAFCTIWGVDADEIGESPRLADIIERAAILFDEAAEYEKLRALLYQDDTPRVVSHGHLRRSDGTEIDFSGVPLPDGATLFTFVDVTDSLRIERALRERNEALETADRLKTEFVAHISYELRTPLNNVMGFAELLDKEYYGPLNAQQHNYTRNIIESSMQLMVLINDILDLAVVESGGLRLEVGTCDVTRMLTSVTAMAREEVRKRHQTLDLVLPDEIGSFEGDEKRIRQVMYNLLSNAMKFTPSRGRITLGAENDDDMIVLYVADTGIGIHADEQEHVFERFSTGRDVPRGQGVGLGLSLVRSFVELHGGTVTLSSEPNVGTRIECHLPRSQNNQDLGRLAAHRSDAVAQAE